MSALPVIDVSRPPEAIAGEIEAACRDSGFFYVAGHGVPAELLTRLEAASRVFFVAQTVLGGIAVSLGLEAEYFAARYTATPTVLFRIFHYPPAAPADDDWGVGEHTDYGLLTLLAQDENAGLEVHTPNGWIDAPPIAGTFVCNLGDMLDRLTGGWYRSTAHRVVNRTGRGRLSFAYFLDPDFDAEIPPLPQHSTPLAGGRRWDGQDVHAFRGTYGDYLVAKVSKVFPQLRAWID